MKSNKVNELENDEGANDLEIHPLLSMIYVVVFETCRDEVDLLNSSYRNARNEKRIMTHIPIEKRFGFSDDVILEQNMQIRLASTQCEFSRLNNILTLLKDILEYGISDLLKNRSYQMLYQVIRDIQAMNDDEFELISNFKTNYKLNSKLTDEALTDRLEALDHIKVVENKIHVVRGAYEGYLQEAAIKYHTLLNWERSRYEQNLHFHKINEEECKESIKEKKRSIRDEEIANREMSKFYVEHMKDLKADILKWMTKYDDDLDATDLSITKQRIEVEEMRTKLQDLQQIISNRDKEMRDWINLRTERKEEAIRNYVREWAAIQIQRWWRSILLERRRNEKKNRRKIATKKKPKK